MKFSLAKRFSEIEVHPYTALLAWGIKGEKHIGGPIWPSFHSGCADDQCLERYWHAVGETYCPIDKTPQQKSALENRYYGDRYYWIGPIYNHFGHQIRDFSSRIIPSLMLDRNAILVFGIFPKRGPECISKSPSFFREIIRWFEVSEKNVLVISKPSWFEKLHVVQQPECSAQNSSILPKQEYIEQLTRNENRKQWLDTSPIKVTFVSRHRRPVTRPDPPICRSQLPTPLTCH